MLKKISLKKALVATSSLIVLLLIYLVPSNDLKEIKQKVNYVDVDVIENDIFLLNKDGFLGKTKVQVASKKNIEKLSEEIITYLIQNSKLESKIPSGFKSILPENTKINSIKYEDSVLKLDLSKDVLEVDEKLEEKMIESLVYSLTTIDEIKYIILYIDGSILTKLPKSGKMLPSALDRNIGINKKYDISSYKDVNKVTVYYIDSFNDEFYYVPVTKYTNDKREKINIIIDELTGTNNYNGNLMSFLNSNTKLLKVNQKADSLDLVFNQYIFDDIDEKNILEEVIYTICLSIADNYDVKEVSFTVDDKEIYKSVLKTLE